ncbi:hypothetical protein [Actinoplanes sp. NPDC023714]|uniref:hypothetical protein n=1 Tax=Actinoplanes sp. NPDC023714 TaxID=3154322 RepID=UPI0033EB4A6D
MEAEDFVDAAVALPIGAWTHVEIRVAATLTFLINGDSVRPLSPACCRVVRW